LAVARPACTRNPYTYSERPKPLRKPKLSSEERVLRDSRNPTELARPDMVDEKFNIKNMEVISDAEAETMDYVVCMKADFSSPFTDNLTGFCYKCGEKVIYRWHAPRKPKRICLECMLIEAAKEK
jgi:predicted RNA-binding Zn-ribbon protein involved in translation (DUF1610 family)